MQKRWVLAETKEVPMEAALQSFFGERQVHPAVTRILVNRGVTKADELEAFFDPSWEKGIHDPFLFSHMQEAVDRLFRAIENGERVTVHGDYDADGVTGSAVVITVLREIEQRIHPSQPTKIDFYIPHRDKEGYGLHPATVEELKQRGTSVIVTVDCGIACPVEIAQAKALGIDTVVVDHHQFGDVLPDAILIHPKLPGESYPFPHLAAVGVAFKLACGLLVEAKKRNLGIPDGWEKWLLDFVSIATVTDMVQIVGENRVLETFGLKVLNKTRRPGMRKLIEAAGCTFGEITSESVAFSIGPRINAAGRMDHASLALAAMLAESEEEAAICVSALENCNRDRQKATTKMMAQAEEQRGEVAADEKIVVLWSENWSPSLVGLVAGRYLDKTGKPVVAIGKHGSRWVGSGRSFSSYDITEAMKQSGEGILTHVGGHVQACGFSFPEDAPFDELVSRLRAHAAKQLSTDELAPLLPVDAEIALEEIDWLLVDSLNALEPLGEGNKRPVFLSRGLEVVSCDLVGSTGTHARCLLRGPSGKTMKFMGFKFGSRIDELTFGKKIDVAFDVGINAWNGRREIQCKLVDVRECIPVAA
ncbi:MAG: single-stranded-DNA-specific exonuclease RecJ [Patescibacteria group bacterium]